MIVQALLSSYLEEVQKLYGLHLKSVILYGSYARGDFTKDSDVDIMILMDLADGEIEQYSDELAEIGFDYNVACGIWMMPVVKNEKHFEHWVKAYLFYENIQKEGQWFISHPTQKSPISVAT